MRKDFGAKPYTYPQPVLMIATYGEDGKPDVMNAAWGGISDDKEISICVSESHKTTENILKKGAFTVSMADVDHMTAWELFPETKSRINLQKPDLQQKSPKK